VSHPRHPADVNLHYTTLQDVTFSQIGSGGPQDSVKRSQPIAQKWEKINLILIAGGHTTLKMKFNI
jgi:hypothetical protein